MKYLMTTKTPAFAFATLLFSSMASAALLNNDGTLGGESTPNGTAPFSQWNRGSVNSVFAAWDVFANPVAGPHAPDVSGSFPTDGSLADGLNGNNASIGMTAGAANSFLVGGNIYSPDVATAFAAEVPGYGNGAAWNTRVVVQFRTRGSGLDFTGLALTYDNTGTQTLQWQDRVYYEQLSATPLGGSFGGTEIDSIVVFDILGFNPSEFTLAFAAASSSMSLANVAVDVFTTQAVLAPVPEPSSFVLVAIGLLGLSTFRRRR